INTPKSAPSTAASQSAPSKKMFGDLPPSSSVTRLRVSAALLTITLPTAALPVKAILSTPGCATSAAPAVSPMPLTMFTTPGGNPASSNQGAISNAVRGVCRNGIHVAENFVGKPRVVFETSGHVRDVVFRFYDGLAGVAAFYFREMRGILPDFLGQFVEQAAALGGTRLRPGTGVKRGAGRFHGLIDVGGVRRRNLCNDLFGRRVVDGKHLAGRTLDPLAVDVILISPNHGLRTTGHTCLPNPIQSAGATAASFRAALRLPYTKKKNAARPMKKSVPPTIQTSYEYKEVICWAGKKASAMPIEVVSNPLAPAAIRVALLYRPFAKESPAAIFRSAPNM